MSEELPREEGLPAESEASERWISNLQRVEARTRGAANAGDGPERAAATAWTPADEEELAALRLKAARRQREEAARRAREEAARREREGLQRQQSDVQCSICLGPYKERAWTKCNHSFCRKCIMQVCLTNYPTNRAPCPFCRQPMLLGELNRRPYEHY